MQEDRNIFNQANSEIIDSDSQAQKIYNEHLEFNGETLGIILFSDYGRLALEYLELNEVDKAKLLFDLIEKFLNIDDKYLSECAKTGFLEAIDHTITDNSYPHKHTTPLVKELIGKESLEYCRAYENFMTKNKGNFWK